MSAETNAGIVRELARIYTVETDQYRLLDLVQRARVAVARVEPQAVIRQDADLMAYSVMQISTTLAQMIFGKPFKHLPMIQQTELRQAAEAFVDAVIEDHAPAEATEPDAMELAKAEAEA